MWQKLNNKNKPKTLVSFIIVSIKYNHDLIKCIESIKSFCKNFEIIIVLNESINIDISLEPNIHYHHIKEIRPSAKRNLAISMSSGDYITFIDDDAYLSKTWFDVFKDITKEKKYLCFGGPGLLIHKNLLSDLQSFIYQLGNKTNSECRYSIGEKIIKINEWPTMNLTINKEVLKDIRFNDEIWPGEDSLLSREIIKKGYDIFYIPNLTVYHNSRSTMKKHFRQIYRYGYMRNKIISEFNYPAELNYYKPFLFFLFNIYLIFINLFNFININIIIGSNLILLIYFIYIFFKTIQIKGKAKLSRFLSLPFSYLGHMMYGYGFLSYYINRKKEFFGR